MRARPRCSTSCSSPSSANTVNLGTGLILLLAAGRRCAAARFTVGDFALFVYYLGCDHRVHRAVRHRAGAATSRPASRSSRMAAAAGRAPPSRLVQHGAGLPQRPAARPSRRRRRAAADRLRTLDVRDLTYRYPRRRARRRAASTSTLERGSLHRDHRAHRLGQDDPAARAARPAAAPTRARSAGTARSWPTPRAFFAPPRSAYTPQVPRLFSETPARQHPARPAARARSTCPRALARGRARARRGRAWPHGLDTPVGPRGVRLSGGQVQRAAAARMFVRARRPAGLRRPLQRARRGDRAPALGARLRPARHATVPGRLAPPRRPAPRRPDHRAQRRRRRATGRSTTCSRARPRCAACGTAKPSPKSAA